MPGSLFRLKALWRVDYVIQPEPAERRTRYIQAIAHSDDYGVCVGLAPLRVPRAGLVGADARQVLRSRLCRSHVYRTAIVDSVLAHVSRPADDVIDVTGAPGAKYAARAEIFAAEAERVLEVKGAERTKRGKPRVLVIGATSGILGALVRRGFDVSATDMAPEAVGKRLAGVVVQDGRKANADLMKGADLAIITGMTLTNRTLERLMTLAKKHGTPTMIWAITGRNFGHYYTEHGVDSVISDPAPFLHLPGPSIIRIWRRTGRACAGEPPGPGRDLRRQAPG